MKRIKLRKVIDRNILIFKVYGFDYRGKGFGIQVRYRIGSDISLLHSCMSDQKFKANQLEIINNFDKYDIELFKKILLKEIKFINNMKYSINRYSFKKSVDRNILNFLYKEIKDKNSFKEI
ncbi:hypothetical protein [Fusobacterium perfoetens]|uniref:hypothetical protein n=1 Tax=Fusobacterium perfoetens TaxID=852 RepID=UPI001F345114|nr:hypothetical protein [Fusobacterium perfoetens]MCF2611598.1 hypothetical protein [Fusobacterium perfoetens]